MYRNLLDNNMAPTKIQFVSDETDGGSASTQFRELLVDIEDQSDQAKWLLYALNKKMMKLKAFRPLGTSPDKSPMYLIMFSGFIDIHLEKLGEMCDMPRGLPIIWYPGSGDLEIASEDHSIKFFGFRRKFKNDKRQGKIPMNASGAAWFKKVSGFHCHLITFEYMGEKCWAALSKNSANMDSKFVIDGGRVLEPYVTDSLWDNLDRIQGHANFELISKNDQAHGNIVSREVPIIVSLGSGSKVTIKSGTVVKDSTSKKIFVDFFGFRDTSKFSIDNGLPVLDAVITTGKGCEYILSKFQENRDKMTDNTYEIVLAEAISKFPEEIQVVPGNVSHSEFSGDVLEGLVVHYVTQQTSGMTPQEIITKIERGETEIEKVKCPRYNYVTMLIREFLKNLFCEPAKKTLPQFQLELDDWADRWCMTPEGKRYWKSIAWETILLAVESKLVANYPIIKSSNPLPPGDEKVGLHIQAANWANLYGTRGNIQEVIGHFNSLSPPRLIGQLTVVMPFASKAQMETAQKSLELNSWAVTHNKKTKPKRVSGWIHLTAIPISRDDSTGRVYQYPIPSNLQKWQHDKLATIDNVHHVRNMEDLVNQISQHQKEDNTVSEVADGEIEREIRDSVQKTLNGMLETLRSNRESGKQTMFLLVSPQCFGKSFASEKLSEEGVVQCSADAEMFKDGGSFDFTKLKSCHSACQLNAWSSLSNGMDVCIDNTNLIDSHRTIYIDIAKKSGADFVPMILAPELWLTSSPEKTLAVVNALEVRSRIRESATGKKIERCVIEKAIGDAKSNIGTRSIDDWLWSAPIVFPKRCLKWDKSTLMYVCPDLTMAAIEGINSPKVKARDNIVNERMMAQIFRGINEFHCTLIDPREGRKLKKSKTPINIPDISEIPAPKVIGVGSVSKDTNHVLYLVLEWSWGDSFRTELGLPKRDFHVTVAFTQNDIHDMGKGVETLEW